MPRMVSIAGLTVRVELMERHDSEARGEYGHTIFKPQVIRIAKDQPAESLANTFLHECMHVMHWQFGLMRQEPDEEQFTLLGTNALCLFFRDNPDVVPWLMKHIGVKGFQ